MKRFFHLMIVLGFMMILSISITSAQQSNAIYQVSVINALLQGVYDGEVDMKEVREHGDFGIGTFDALDGEMIGLDGIFYQVKGTGEVLPVKETIKTPFATVIYFQPEQRDTISQVKDYGHLQHILNEKIKNQNSFYAIRIDGEFSYIKTRSVPSQQKPYKSLAEVTKKQPTFEFENVKGTILGFWCPQFVNGVNVPGYHLHFISDDRTQGGHLLAVSIKSATVKTASIHQFKMVLPKLRDFQQAALDKDYSRELKVVEQQ